MVLNGGYRGNEGILESINEKKFSVTITIDSVSIKHCKLLFAESFPSVHGELSERTMLPLILPYRWDLWCAKFCGQPPTYQQPHIPTSQAYSLLFSENLQKDDSVLNLASLELARDLYNILSVYFEHGCCGIVLWEGKKCKICKDVNLLLPFPD